MYYKSLLKKHLANIISFIRTALIFIAFASAFILTGCQRTEPSAAEQTNTNQPSALPTDEIKSKFRKEDLIVNGVSVDAAPAEIEEVLGSPQGQTTTMDQVTGGDILTYTYEGLQLIFRNDNLTDESFHLKSVDADIPGYLFIHDLQIGNPYETVINSFTKEEDDKIYQGFSVLYGDPDLLDDENVTDEIAFGCYDEDQAYFLSMVPPYMS